MAQIKLHLRRALLPTGWADDVTLLVGDDGLIEAVAAGVPAGGADRVAGIAVPGMANVHSHAHQRAMAGLAERAGPGTDTFWTWREAMYGFALKMRPEEMEAVAAQLYVEMLKAGYTAVGEFQYLHHQPDGTPYAEPAEMTLRCLAATEQAGIATTLLPSLYAHGGFGGQPTTGGQRRFACDLEGFLAILEACDRAVHGRPLAKLGIAPHSLRAVTPELLAKSVIALDRLRPGAPVHMHIAEQVKEVEDCAAWSNRRPVELLFDRIDVDRRWCFIHATHMTEAETRRMAGSGAVVGLCPTTEANLGDGTFQARIYLGAEGALAMGTDSQIDVSVAHDLRQLEYSQRLAHRERNVLADGPGRSTGRRLFETALVGGARAIQQPMGRIEAGARADLVVLDADHPALIGREGDEVLDSWIFCGGNACVRDVYVAGRPVVTDRRHRDEDAIFARFRTAMARLRA